MYTYSLYIYIPYGPGGGEDRQHGRAPVIPDVPSHHRHWWDTGTAPGGTETAVGCPQPPFAPQPCFRAKPWLCQAGAGHAGVPRSWAGTAALYIPPPPG